MELLAGLGLAGLAIYFVVRPLWDPGGVERHLAGEPELEALLAERAALHQALKDLDLDWELGRVSEGDHQTQRRAHVLRAASLLQEIDQRSATAHSRETAPAERCRRCGYPQRPEDRYCPQCGTPFRVQG